MSTSPEAASTVKDTVRAAIEERSGAFVRLAHDIHAHPEPAFAEQYAAGRITDTLADAGFDIRLAVFDLPTAFVARIGNGPLHIAFCAEHDALDDGIGHGGGHHLTAGAAVAAATGLHGIVDEVGLMVSVIGTPGGADASAFDGVHAALTVHAGPSPCTELALLRNDPVLAAIYRRNAEALGRTVAPDGESQDQIDQDGTDLDAVSHGISSIHPMIGIGGLAPTNTVAFTAQADTDDAYRAMLDAAVALAWTALDAATDPAVRSHLLDRARPRWSS